MKEKKGFGGMVGGGVLLLVGYCFNQITPRFMGLGKNMVTLIGILLIILGFVVLNTDSDFSFFGIILMAGGIVCMVAGLFPLLSQIQ